MKSVLDIFYFTKKRSPKSASNSWQVTQFSSRVIPGAAGDQVLAFIPTQTVIFPWELFSEGSVNICNRFNNRICMIKAWISWRCPDDWRARLCACRDRAYNSIGLKIQRLPSRRINSIALNILSVECER